MILIRKRRAPRLSAKVQILKFFGGLRHCTRVQNLCQVVFYRVDTRKVIVYNIILSRKEIK